VFFDDDLNNSNSENFVGRRCRGKAIYRFDKIPATLFVRVKARYVEKIVVGQSLSSLWFIFLRLTFFGNFFLTSRKCWALSAVILESVTELVSRVLASTLDWLNDASGSHESWLYVLRDSRNIFLYSFDHRLCKQRPIMHLAVVFYVGKNHACKLEIWVFTHVSISRLSL